MYSLQKRLLELEEKFDNLDAEKESKHLLDNLKELRQIKQNLKKYLSEISSTERADPVTKLAESNVLVDRGLPYISLNKNTVDTLQKLNYLIQTELTKQQNCKKQENIDIFLDKFQNENSEVFLKDVEESKFFFNNVAGNISVILEVLKDICYVEETNHTTTSMMSSCSSITVDFENCKNNPNVAASSPVNL